MSLFGEAKYMVLPYILLPLGFFSVPTIYWPFQGSPQAEKNIALGPLFVAAREDRGSGKAENAYIHHKQNSRMGKV